MDTINNYKKIIENSVLLLVAAVVGLIVSAVAQIFMIAAKNIFTFIFNNKDFEFTIEIGTFSLNLLPLLICIPSSYFSGFINVFFEIT